MSFAIGSSKTFCAIVLIGVLGAILSQTTLGLFLEEKFSLNSLFIVRGAISPPKNLVIISIDNASANFLHLPDEPDRWPRTLLTDVVETLNHQKAEIIAFDVIFDEKSERAVDQKLAEAMKSQQNVVLSNYVKRSAIPFSQNAGKDTFAIQYDRIVDPLPLFDQAAQVTAPFLLPKTASSVNQFWTYKSTAGGIPTLPVSVFYLYFANKAYPAFLRLVKQHLPLIEQKLPPSLNVENKINHLVIVLRLVRQAFNEYPDLKQKFSEAVKNASMSRKKKRLILSWMAFLNNESLYFNHYGPARTIETVPFYKVINDELLEQDFFDQKVVFIGYSDNLQAERNQGFYTVYSKNAGATVDPVEMVASAFANLSENTWIKPLSGTYQLFMILGWVILLSFICRKCIFKRMLFFIVVVSGIAITIAYFMFVRQHVWLPLFIPVFLQGPLIVLVTSIAHYRSKQRQHQSMHRAMSFYLPGDVVEQISMQQGSSKMEVISELKSGVCMATDAGKYTSLAETIPPMELGDLMNRYYAEIFRPVKQQGGFVSDVIGDAMLAIWADPSDNVSTRQNACKAALLINQIVEQFNLSQPHQLPTRIGLHFGSMRLGNVGSVDHFEYRAVGDTVNTASRIEGLNKALGTRMLVSQDTIEGLTNFVQRELGSFLLEGKRRPITIYELVGLTDADVAKTSVTLLGEFADALQYFKNEQLEAAKKCFLALQHHFPEDGPIKFYLKYFDQLNEKGSANVSSELPYHVIKVGKNQVG